MKPPRVLLFDVNETLLDLKPVKERVGTLLGKGPEAARLWFTTLLQHSLVMTAAGHFADFAQLGAACLHMVARMQGIELTDEQVHEAVALMRSLPAYPDVAPALARLAGAGYRLAPLTNSSRSALTDQVRNSGLARFFEEQLSVEEVGMYKPHTHVYRWAARRMGVDVSECMMVAAHGWDVAGAAWVGMSTTFVARPGQQEFPLGPPIDFTVSSLEQLADRLVKKT